jgi:hypothetical protein
MFAHSVPPFHTSRLVISPAYMYTASAISVATSGKVRWIVRTRVASESSS